LVQRPQRSERKGARFLLVGQAACASSADLNGGGGTQDLIRRVQVDLRSVR